jgi:SAM-dependent methyltransferase
MASRGAMAGGALAGAAAAFDREAAVYDDTFGRNPVGLLFRHAFQDRLERLFARGDRVVDLGCGTGEDALFLASRGRKVLGLDVSAAMIARGRAKASARGLAGDAARFEVASAESVDALADGVPFDGAFSDFGALNCTDLAAVGRALARALRPGAPVLLSLMGPRPFPASLRSLFRGRPLSRGASRPKVGGLALGVSYPTRRQVQSQMGPELVWRDAFALGVLVPGPDHGAWAERHPQWTALLFGLEALVRRLPLFRDGGDHCVLEGARR